MKKNNTEKLFYFFIDCFIKLQKHNVKLLLSKSKEIFISGENIKVHGYWDDSNKKNLYLACAVQSKNLKWLQVFIHEYCHFLQYLEKNKIWRAANKITADDSYKILHNKPFDQKKLEQYLDALRNLEIDCEKRVVKLIKKYKLPIDTKKYIKEANAYIYFYNHIKVYREWYKSNEPPYINKELVKLCKPEFSKNYNVIPKKLQKKLNEFYQPKKINNLKSRKD